MQHISCEDYKRMRDAGEPHILLDVREQEEWDTGHMEDALHLPLGLVETTADMVLPDKNEQLIVCCARGGRSRKACKMLKKLGYTNITNLEGGYLGYCDVES